MQVPHRANKTSFGLKFWSMMGAQQDVKTIKQAEKAEQSAIKKSKKSQDGNPPQGTSDSEEEVAGVEVPGSPRSVRLPGRLNKDDDKDDLAHLQPLGVLPPHENGEAASGPKINVVQSD